MGASDRYTAEGFSSAEEGEKACEEEGPGLRAGDYTIQNVEIPTARRWQRWRSKPGGDRSYDLVRGGAMGWEIDGFAGALPRRD